MSKKIFVLFLIIVMSAVTLSGCATQTAPEAKTRTVVDVMGREVTFNDPIKSVIAVPWPWASFIFAVDGKADRISSMSSTALASYKNCMFQILAPGLGNTNTGYIDDTNKTAGSFGTPNIEELAKINPDLVIIYKRDAATMLPIFERVNIPVVVFDYNGLKEVQDGLLLLGNMLGKDALQNAQTIVNWHQEASALMSERLASLTDNEKPKVLHLYDDKLRVVNNAFNDNMIKEAGGINVASMKGNGNVINADGGTVNFEQILLWDPDIIILGNFSNITPEQIYNNTLAGQDWSKLKAVKNKQVYKIPMGLYRWDAPNTEAHLFLYWLAKLQQPKLFTDINLEEKTQDFYKTLFHHTVTPEEMSMIYHDDLNAKSAKIK